MTDISNNWLDLSYQSNLLNQTYIGGFIDISSNIVTRQNVWIKNEKTVGNTRFGLGTISPSSVVDSTNDDPVIRIINTSLNSVTQNNTNLGTIEFASPNYRNASGINDYQTSGSIRCENLYQEYSYNGSLIFSTGGSDYNATDKLVIRSDNGNIGIGTDNPNSSLNVEGDMISISTNNTGEMGYITGLGTMPVGMIIMYYGDMDGKSPNTKLEGTLHNWKLCDGTNYTQYGIVTPDLRNSFIVGAGIVSGKSDDYYTTGDTGGLKEVTLTLDELAIHKHSQSTAGTEARHYHHLAASEVDDHHWPNSTTPYTAGSDTKSDTDYGPDYTSNSGTHRHHINYTGGGDSHENRPPYYALVYIMRVY